MKNWITLIISLGIFGVLNAQDVGIGLSNPLYRLHVQENNVAGPQLMVENSGAQGFTSIDLNAGGDAYLRFRNGNVLHGGLSWDFSDQNLSLYINQNPEAYTLSLNQTTGHVGIGTVSPATKLHVHKHVAEDTGIRISNPNTSNRGLDLVVNSDGEGQIKSAPFQPLFLYSKSGVGAAVKLYTNGHVGINTQNIANYDLEVEGDFATLGGNALVDGNAQIDGNAFVDDKLFVGTTTPSLYQAEIVHSTHGLNLVKSATGDHWELYVTSGSGDLGLFFNSTTTGHFEAATGEYVATSDRRLKTDFQSLSNVLPDIMKLRPLSYFFRSDKVKTRRSLGFVAQDVEPLFPDLVSISEDERIAGMYYLNYKGISVLAIAAIQEQQQQIEKLTSEIAELKNRLNKFEETPSQLAN